MVKVAVDGSKQLLIGVLAQVRKRREVEWNKTSADEGFKSLKIGSTSESPPGTGSICQLGDDDRSVNCLQRDVVHAVSTQDSESVQSLHARTDDSMNVIRSNGVWKMEKPPFDLMEFFSIFHTLTYRLFTNFSQTSSYMHMANAWHQMSSNLWMIVIFQTTGTVSLVKNITVFAGLVHLASYLKLPVTHSASMATGSSPLRHELATVWCTVLKPI